MTETELRKALQNPDLLALNRELFDVGRTPDAPSPASVGQTARRNKYNARRTQVDGITFDSAAEARRYGELKRCEMAGEISNLRCQVKFPIHVNSRHIADYIADFVYHDEQGRFVVEDVKSVATRTPVYRLKRKLIEAIYKFTITEVVQP